MATDSWPLVPLGEVLTQTCESRAIRDDETYKQVTVRLHGKGLVLRQEAPGHQIKTKHQYCVSHGQFVYSRIDARNGAMGLVPPELSGAIVSNDFPIFDVRTDRLLPDFLRYYVSTTPFTRQCLAASAGTTNRRRLKEENFLAISIPLPPLDEQRRIVARIEALAGRIEAMRCSQKDIGGNLLALLVGAYYRVTQGAAAMAMAEVAPLIRRPAHVVEGDTYLELGIRSFGKGTFHKPSVDGAALGEKRVFYIEPGDLLFSNVFAWEGAVAVARPEDSGRIGSHRFITCLADPVRALPEFLCFHFLTEEGLQQLGNASPGAAGRNRTLGLKALEKIQVPVPPLSAQKWFVALKSRADMVSDLQSRSGVEMDALFAAVLDKAFRGEL